MCGCRRARADSFEVWNKKCPQVLFPAFQLQAQLRRTLLGDGFWDTQKEKRNKLNNTERATVFALLNAQTEAMAANKVRKEIEAEKANRWTPANTGGHEAPAGASALRGARDGA
jgi:hypothetical protein